MARRLQVQRVAPAPSFISFGKLPNELKNRIWLYTLPGPRIVEIFFQGNEEPSDYPEGCDIKAVSPTKPPSLLFVSGESRFETKRQYKALNLGHDIHIPNPIYVDFSIDTVYLSKIQIRNSVSSLIKPLRCPQLHNLQSLVIDASVWAHLPLSFLKTSCANLKCLTITFQKSTLQDIKPASSAETVSLMYEHEYFSHHYAISIFAADWEILRKARDDRDTTKEKVLSSFKPYEAEPSLDRDTNKFLGVLIEKRHVNVMDEYQGTTYELVFQGRRVVDLKFAMALYPRESQYKNLELSSIRRSSNY